jgi:hypothetical protein
MANSSPMSCGEGDTGFIYEGELPFDVQRVDIKGSRPPSYEGDDECRQSGGSFCPLLHTK